MSRKVTREEMLDRAKSLVPAIRGRAAETEKLGELHPDTIKDLIDAGLWRIVQPARVGGGELDYTLIIEATQYIGSACGSTGWAFSNLSSHHWMVAMYDERAQNEVWDSDPETLIATSVIYPAGRAKKVKGGFELTGRWPFCSGIMHSGFAILGGLVEGESKDSAPEPRMFLVAKGDLEIHETWDVIGLAGTGSKDVSCEKLFLPDYRTLGAHQCMGDPTPGSAVNPAPLYRLPVAGLFAHLISGPILGMATGIYNTVLGGLQTQVSTYNKSRVADHQTTHLRISKAGAGLDAARMMMLANCNEAMGIAEAGRAPSREEKFRWRRDSAFATQLCADAADTLYRGTGASAIYNRHPLPLQYRDINAGLVHIGISWDVNGGEYGKVILGLDPTNKNI